MMSSSPPADGAPGDPYAEILRRHADREGSLLPIFHDVQRAFGFIPPEAIGVVAEALNLTRAEVHGAVTFYHDFRPEAPGRRVLKLCQAEACQARGARALTQAVQARLGIGLGETTADRAVTLEAIYCLGMCASGPAALVDGRPLGRLKTEDVARLVEPCG